MNKEERKLYNKKYREEHKEYFRIKNREASKQRRLNNCLCPSEKTKNLEKEINFMIDGDK